MISKQARYYAIKELVSTQSVANQEELRRELRRRGIAVTQATLSRDLQTLGVNHAPMGGKRIYVLQPDAEVQSLRPVVGAEVVSIAANESLVVIRTLPGCASTIGEYVDLLKSPDIIGTVAGDNTLLIIPGSGRRTKKVRDFLKRQLIKGG
jgi:transcriptional regulator of arginine metabolism